MNQFLRVITELVLIFAVVVFTIRVMWFDYHPDLLIIVIYMMLLLMKSDIEGIKEKIDGESEEV